MANLFLKLFLNLKYRKRFLFAFILILTMIYIFLSLFNKNVEVIYLTEKAQINDIEINVLADGTLQASKQVSVGSQVSGQIKKLHVKLGDYVKKGDILIEIDDLHQKNALADAKARLKNIEATKMAKNASLKNLKLTFERQSILSKKGASRLSEMDLAQANLDSILAEIEAIDAQINQTKIALDTAILNLSYTKITAPIDGFIVALVVEEGQTVNSVQSAPTLMKIANLSLMTVKTQISEADVTKVKPGMPLYFTVLGDKKRRFTTLQQIEPAPESIQIDTKVNTSTSTEAIYYNGLFNIENEDLMLKISMTAQVVISINEKKNVITIPASALNYYGDQKDVDHVTYVRILKDDNSIEERDIIIGLNNNIHVEVISGLKAGEKVVISDSSDNKSSKNPQILKGRRR